MMNAYKIFLFSVMALLMACSNEEDSLLSDAALEMKGIRATIDDEMLVTRAVPKLGDVIGRSAFTADDKIVFTSIKRAENPLEAFTYSNIIYAYDGNSWERTEVILLKRFIGLMALLIIPSSVIVCRQALTIGRQLPIPREVIPMPVSWVTVARNWITPLAMRR